MPLPRPLRPACSCRPPLPGTQEAWLPPPASLAAPTRLLLSLSSFSRRTHCSDASAAAFGTREELSTTRLQGAAGLKGTAQPGPPQSFPVPPSPPTAARAVPGSHSAGERPLCRGSRARSPHCHQRCGRSRSHRVPGAGDLEGVPASCPIWGPASSRDWVPVFMGAVASLDPKWFCPQPGLGLLCWGGRWAPAGGAAPAPWGEGAWGILTHS